MLQECAWKRDWLLLWLRLGLAFGLDVEAIAVMPARLPLQAKSPFRLDPRPLTEMSSSRAGLLAASRALRSFHLPALVEANLSLKSRARGFTEPQAVESLVLLHIAGGDCPDDFSLFHGDQCLERGLGYALPKARTARDFLDPFHDEASP